MSLTPAVTERLAEQAESAPRAVNEASVFAAHHPQQLNEMGLLGEWSKALLGPDGGQIALQTLQTGLDGSAPLEPDLDHPELREMDQNPSFQLTPRQRHVMALSLAYRERVLEGAQQSGLSLTASQQLPPALSYLAQTHPQERVVRVWTLARVLGMAG